MQLQQHHDKSEEKEQKRRKTWKRGTMDRELTCNRKLSCLISLTRHSLCLTISLETWVSILGLPSWKGLRDWGRYKGRGEGGVYCGGGLVEGEGLVDARRGHMREGENRKTIFRKGGFTRFEVDKPSNFFISKHQMQKNILN